MPGTQCLGKQSFPNLKRGMREPDQSSDALTTPDTDEITNTQDGNSKFSLTKARTVDNHTLTDNELTSPKQIPEYILQALMIVNYHAREFKLKPLITDKYYNKTNKIYDSDESEDEDQNKTKVSDADKILDEVETNPMDGLLWIFHCSDIFLRQALVIKLTACQLSVPFLLPDPKAPSTNVTILLSALESIIKSWKINRSNDKESAQEVFATYYPFPVVSFIRIGKVTMSKSSLMNKIISDGNCEHHFFFHKNLQGGDVKRKVVDGLVELCWYLPGGSDKLTLENEICFANLRGDATSFKKQLYVLLQISSVFCILLDSGYPDEKTRTILKESTKYKAKIILVFNEEREKGTKKYYKDLKSEHDEKFSSITASTKPNEYSFLQIMRESIQKNMDKVEATPLVELASCAGKLGIYLDNNQLHSLEKPVDTWLKQGIIEAKNLLKLQVHVPKLADLEREKYCPKRQGRRDDEEIFEDIEAEERRQKESFDQLDENVFYFLRRFAVMDKTERNCCLNKLKHELDKMSLQIMDKLHQEYHVTFSNLQKKKKETGEKKLDTIASEEEHLKLLEESIKKCSFGVEHIIREFAQLYQLPDICTIDYAGAAAEMLITGHPLELLDGDSSYIPMEWFKAVYTELENKTNNAKIFVISVLGIQSSGKSTMLNTMFGLEFPVSVGRCTRGAFASLIPVSRSLKSASHFDYILIIDTEGLRGSGDPQLREHDNELATFAIGVADVAIVNILGESPDVMKEFLEMAVHAFLKMKLVKERKICKIVHQNVAATDATKKLTVDRFHLKKNLDEMARLAATQENCEYKVENFNDIISFDENEDVFYIPSFLEGSPPMAPVNPDYGKAVQHVKENIITLMCSSKDRFHLSVSQFRERVRNLWTAMLKENFIFSFRNTIEVRAFTSLDRKYFEVSVNLMVIGMAKVERQIQVTLERCATRHEREKNWKLSKRQIDEEAERLRVDMEKEMNDFFETSEDKATLEQWKENMMGKIVQFKENQKIEVEKKCFATFMYLQNRQEVEERKQACEYELLQKAKDFIFSAHADDVEKSKAAFEHAWQQWIADVPQSKEEKENVNEEMINVLYVTNRILETEMRDKLKQQNSSISNFKLRDPTIIDNSQLQVSFARKIYSCLGLQEILSLAKLISEQAIDNGLNFAKTKSKSGDRCTPNDLTQMYHKVITTIEKESEEASFKFSTGLKCDILLYTFANAYGIFEEMEERYIQERNIRGNLEQNLRPKLESYFQNLCSEMKKEVLAASAIFHVLQSPIESVLNRTMGPAVTGEMRTKSKYLSKDRFHATVLIELGEEGKFTSYISYFENPMRFLKAKLTESIENSCLKEENASVTELLKKETIKIKSNVFSAISKTNELTKTGTWKLTLWIEQFVKHCSTLVITKEMFAVAEMDKNDLKDIDVFDTKLRENITQFLESLIKRGVNRATIRKWDPSPHDQILPLMFGCQSFCPFCKCLCDQTTQNHEGPHSSKAHRPRGLCGYRDNTSKILVTTICTCAVADDNLRFRNADTSGEWHLYKDYQSVNDYYKSWLIPGEGRFEASPYWKWFMAKFPKELATHYEAEQPAITAEWKSHLFRVVKYHLQQKYDM